MGDGEESVRAATPVDLPAIEALVEAAYAPWVERIGMRPGPMRTDYAAALAESVVFVREVGSEVVGLLVLTVEAEALMIENVAVSPSRQGEGIGRELIEHAEKEARARGLPRVRLYAHEKMIENIALYERLGFEGYERRESSGFARVFMQKYL